MAFALNQTRTGESYAITKRREIDAHYGRYEGIKIEDQHLAQRANWEINTQKMIERNEISNLARSIESGERDKLEARRRKLAALVKGDEATQRNELANLRETSQQKAKRMVGHARKLKAERENKRIVFAQEMYNRQWKNACDDLRLIGSERFAAHCKEEIAVQRVEQARKRHADKEENNMWATTWEEERMTRVQKEDEQRRQRQRNNYETKMALFNQMENARKTKLKEAYETEMERDAFRNQMEEDEAYAKACQAKNTADAQSRMQEIIEFNQRTQSAKNTVAQAQQQQELRDLNLKMAEHEKDLEEKQKMKERMREESLSYMAYLKEQKREQKEMEAFIEQLSLEEQDRENAKRDAQWQREQDSRDRLKDDVYAGRAQQLAEIHEKHQKLEAELEMERQVVLSEAVIAADYEYTEEEDFRRAELRVQQDLMRQMQEKREQDKITAALIIEDRENAITAERNYRAFVQRERQEALKQGVQIPAKFFS